MKEYKKINKLLKSLSNSTPIYLAGHITPDQDSICSSIALAEYLTMLGKKAYVLLADDDKDIIDWLDDDSLITDKVKSEKFVFISLDVNTKNRLGRYEKYFEKAELTINIDHHQNNKKQSNYVLSKPGISSTCEMIYNLITCNSEKYLTKKICRCLYAGILTDTNGFTRRISNKTFGIAQNLVNKEIDYVYITKKTLFETSIYEAKALAKAINNLLFDGIYYVVIDKKDKDFKDLTNNFVFKHISEELRKITDINIFLVMIKNGENITAKIMTNYEDNANKIAELFDGGGHKKEAGFETEKSVKDILKTIKNFLKKDK